MHLYPIPHRPDSFPIAMEPARAAAAAKYRTATGGQKTRRLKELRDLTTEALIWDRRRRNG
jgi:hypothetical protein